MSRRAEMKARNPIGPGRSVVQFGGPAADQRLRRQPVRALCKIARMCISVRIADVVGLHSRRHFCCLVQSHSEHL
jgi:hypothetical protein